MARTAKKKIAIKDEGILLTEDADSIDFAGAGVSGSAINNDIIETIPTQDLSVYLKLDQTTPQTIINGQPIWNTLTASKVVFTDASKKFTSTGIGTSSQFIKGDGSLDSSAYITAAALSGYVPYTDATGDVNLNNKSLVNVNELGVGITTPASNSKVHIGAGTSGVSSFDGNSAIILEGNGASGTGQRFLAFYHPSTTSDYTGFAWGDENDAFVSQIGYKHSDDSFRIYSNNGTRLFINSSGYVGLNTTSPAEILDVNGNIGLPATSSTVGNIKVNTVLRQHWYGEDNFFLGGSTGPSGNYTTTGSNNFFAGRYTGFVLTSGSGNVGIGNATLAYVTTGGNNVALGSGAGQAIQTGANNFALGLNSLNNLVGGVNNVAIGVAALTGTLGSYNVGIGGTAGAGNTSGEYNVFIGYGATCSAGNFTNATAIGLNAVAGASNTVILGNGAKVGIGTSTPTDLLTVAGALTTNFASIANFQSTVSPVAGQNFNNIFSRIYINPTENAFGSNTSGTQNVVFKQGNFNFHNTGGYGMIANQSTFSVSGNGGVSGSSFLSRMGFEGNAGQVYEFMHFNITSPYNAGTGTIDAIYGVYINAQKQSYVTTAYGMYQAGASDMNYFAGKVGIGSATPSAFLHIIGTTEQLRVGYDASNYLSATVASNNTVTLANAVAADININCGADKTIVLTETVWNDLQYSISSGRVGAANFPDWDTFTTNTSEYKFAVNDYIDLASNELPHWWKEGTDGKPHMHVALDGANSSGSNQYAKFTLYIAYAGSDTVWTETSKDIEITIPTGTADRTELFGNGTTLSLTGLTIGTQLKIRVKRITATGGTEYPNHIFINQIGLHLEQDTIGSRQIAAK